MRTGFKNIIILIFIIVYLCDIASAQQTPAKTDSSTLYKNIESYSKRSKFKKLLYQLFFKPVVVVSKKKTVKKESL